jgi:hypothetical protein
MTITEVVCRAHHLWLLELTHGQWLYRNMHVHGAFTWRYCDKEERRYGERRIDSIDLDHDHIKIRGEDLTEEDRYLLGINLEEVDSSSGEDSYWPLQGGFLTTWCCRGA